APPTVSLTAPTNNATFVTGSNITLTANAGSAGGSIASVGFYENGALLGTSTASPYSFTWTNVPVGTYTLTAVATDNNAVTATSAKIVVTVAPGPPPAAPTNLGGSIPGSGKVKLTWADNSTNESSFAVYRSTDAVNFTQVGAAGANATSF